MSDEPTEPEAEPETEPTEPAEAPEEPSEARAAFLAGELPWKDYVAAERAG